MLNKLIRSKTSYFIVPLLALIVLMIACDNSPITIGDSGAQEFTGVATPISAPAQVSQPIVLQCPSSQRVELSVLVEPLDAGNVEIAGSEILTNGGATPVCKDDQINIIARPNENWRLDHWEMDVTGTRSTAVIVMTGSKKVRAIFVPVSETRAEPQAFYKLTVNGEAVTNAVIGLDNGAIAVSPAPGAGELPYMQGAIVVLTARAFEGFVFDGWVKDCAGAAPCVLLMNGNKSVEAVIRPEIQTPPVPRKPTPTPTPTAVPTPVLTPTAVPTPTPMPIPTATPIPVIDDHGDHLYSATVTELNPYFNYWTKSSVLQITGELETPDDIDVFSFEAYGGEEFFVFSPRFLPLATDTGGGIPKITLYGASWFTPLATIGLEEILKYTPGSPGIIYLAVSNSNPRYTGKYRVIVTRGYTSARPNFASPLEPFWPAGAAAPTPTPVPTQIPLPTAVPTPVPTPVPTAVPTPVPTPVPTAVPTPVPTPVPTAVPTPSNQSIVVSTDVPKNIPDPGEVSSTLTFPTSGLIADMTLVFKFTHSCERDLIIDFIHPDGTTITVMNRGLERCDGPASYDSVNSSVANFFLNNQAAGTWTLVVKDDGAGNTGTLDFWSLEITVSAPAPTPTPGPPATPTPTPAPTPVALRRQPWPAHPASAAR